MYYKNINDLFDAIAASQYPTSLSDGTTYKNLSRVGNLGLIKTDSTVYPEDADTHYIYEIPVPGLTKDTISLKLKNGKLEIAGGLDGHKWSPPFNYNFSLPKNADAKTVRANVEHGVLYIKIDKDKEFETNIKIV